MQTVTDVGSLDSSRSYWVPCVVAPHRNWAGVPRAHRGSRFLIDAETLRPSRSNYPAFEAQGECLSWIMAHRAELTRNTPGAAVKPVLLAHWLLGLS